MPYTKKKNSHNILTSKLLLSRMFSKNALAAECKKVLDDFCDIVDSVLPLSAKNQYNMPKQIESLSKLLTYDKGQRLQGYMNDVAFSSSYIRYFMWWNLVRLTRVFINLPCQSFDLKDKSVCIDIGSGPLVTIIALWLSCPQLRGKNITWYALDISQNIMAKGFEIFLAVVAKTNMITKKNFAPWKIIRVHGSIGENIKQKCDILFCCNVFNEVLQSTKAKMQQTAKQSCDLILSYLTPKAKVFFMEPGVPEAASFLSCMRGELLKKGFFAISPCPHSCDCCMPGRQGQTKKWCNFAFNTKDSPKRLLALSKKSHLEKEKLCFSYIFLQNLCLQKTQKQQDTFLFRITSNVIKLPSFRKGFYACSTRGLCLLTMPQDSKIKLMCGDLVAKSLKNAKMNNNLKQGSVSKACISKDKISKDKKSGAFIIDLE